MIEKIKKEIFSQFNPEEKKGAFLSCYNDAKQLLISQGVVTTNEPLRNTLESIYKSYVADYLKEIQYIAVDVVADIIEVVDPKDLPTFSPQEFGFAIIDIEDDKSGVILPNTSGQKT